MNQDLDTDDDAAPETKEKPVLVEPGPDASPDEWVRYVNQRYPRHGVTAPGSHMGRL
ncbi:MULTISPECIES: hypothetical protein [Amycolatopsis]|uniref:Uncharacterized protein n=1 Tax=Amycolatopsis albidoflavus TaxID=102226 RepID=A0ABW5I4Q4_9PSEU